MIPLLTPDKLYGENSMADNSQQFSDVADVRTMLRGTLMFCGAKIDI